METGLIQQRSGDVSNQLGSNFRIRFPPFSSDRKVFAKSATRSDFDALNNSRMVDKNMVPRVTPNVCEDISPPSSEKQASERYRRKESLHDLGKISQTNGLELLKERKLKNYDSAWVKWVSWCSEREVWPVDVM